MSLTIQGTLAETTVPDLFRSLIRTGETGIVSLEAIGRHDNIFFREGKIISATTSDPDLGLAEVLLRSGEINLKQYTKALEELFSSRRIESHLCDLGYLQPEDLPHVLERQAAEIVTHALGYRTGSYTVDFAEDLPEEIAALPLNTELLVMNGVNRIEHWSLVARGIGRMERLLRQPGTADARIFHLDLEETEMLVYSLFGEPQSIQSACERSYLSNFVTCRAIWSLLSVNLLEDAEEEEVGVRRAEVERELELESLVEQYNSAFQKIFTIVFQQIGDSSYDFIDRVVLHVSPGILPFLSGMNLMNEGRLDFEQFLNNLIASGSDAEQQQLVRNTLNELLYGWMHEVKKEFGNRLETQISEAIGPLRSA